MSKPRTFILIFALLLGSCGGQPPEVDNTITVWHWMGDRENTFRELANRYEALTGTPVRFELYAPSDIYSQKIKAAAQTNTLPDIYGILGDTKDFASFIRSGFVSRIPDVDSKGVRTAWRDTLFQKALAVNTFKKDNVYGIESGVYGVPLDMTNVQLLYNRDLLRQAGLNPDQPPQTWEEFIETGKTLREHNIPVLVSGFGELWLIDILSTSFAMNIMGEEKVYETYRGNVLYNDEDWIRVLNAFKTLTDLELLVPGTVTMVNKSAEQTFANNKAAFAWNGSWCVNVYKGMNPDLDYRAMLPPRISNVHPVRIWGGAGNSFMVNAGSSQQDKAMEFLAWMTEKDQQAYFANSTNNLPANRQAIRNLDPILADFADDLDNTFHLNTMPVHEFPRVMQAWNKGIQAIMIGEKTPAEVADHVQKIKDREIARKART